MRIISLVPSLTKTLVDGGLESQLVGITSFCVDPPRLRRSTVDVGGTKNPDLKLIANLSPTHIVTNDEENRKEDILQLDAWCRDRGVMHVRTFPKTPRDVVVMLLNLREVFGCKRFAKMADELGNLLDELAVASSSVGRYLYFIWRDPYMVAGKDTYISHLLGEFGLQNAATADLGRYPSFELDDLQKFDVDYYLLSSEPFAFRRRHEDLLRSDLGHGRGDILKVDGKLLSWWGSLTIDAVRVLKDAGGALSGL